MFVPDALKDFSLWLSPRSLQAFNKLDILRKGKSTLTCKGPSFKPSEFEPLSKGLENDLSGRGVFALRLYFYQFFREDSLSLDLRASRMSFANHWHYNVGAINFDFSKEFKRNIIRVYDYYYEKEEQDLVEALEYLGLFAKGWGEQEKQELSELFIKHFNNAKSSQQVFSFNDLYNSFSKIFSYIKDQGGKVPSEFAILGIYLSSLYLNLTELTDGLDVKKAYLFAKNL